MKMQVFRGANVKLRNWRQVTVYNETSTNIEVETDCAKIRKRTG